ncbi:MAG: HAD family hydrolase [Candidatus Promineifilaceae bacterium]
MISAIVFDMDGVLVDSEPLSRQAWEQLAAEYHYTLDDETYRQMVGRRTEQSVQMFLAACPVPLLPEVVVARKTAYLDAIRAEVGVPVMPGLDEVLTAVNRLGLPWAVATSSRRHHAEENMAQLGLSPVIIAAGDEVVHGKPAPDIYLLAAERLGVSPEVCLAVEDSLPGCQAAMAAGMLVTAVPNGITKNNDFSGVPFVLESLYTLAQKLPSIINH